MTELPDADDVRSLVAQAMCRIEVRSRAKSLEEVAAGIPLWTRYIYEAERLIDELKEFDLDVVNLAHWR